MRWLKVVLVWAALVMTLIGNISSGQQVDKMPIADLHFHPEPELAPAEMLSMMDKLGVRWAGNGARRGGDGVWSAFGGKNTDRFIPFAGQSEINRLIQKHGEATWTLKSPEIESYVQTLDEKLRSGQFRGIGELFVNRTGTKRSESKYPADSPLMQRLFAIATNHQAPLSIHMNAESGSVEELSRLLASNTKGTIIWAHCGHYADAALVRKLMSQHANLLCELSYRDDRRLGRGAINVPITGFSRRLKSDWKGLLEDHSGQFLIGTDTENLSEYPALILFYRDILGQLNPDAAKRLAYENARRIFRLPDA